ncbi:MAG: hypothetical protein D6719_09785, partial [Candidatus Dadabacteria bacterium]
LDKALLRLKDLQENNPVEYRRLLNALTPVLPELCGVSLPDKKGDDADSRLSYYKELRDNIIGHIKETLKKRGIVLESVSNAGRINLLVLEGNLDSEIKKYRGSFSDRLELELRATKGLLDVFYGDLGDCCIVKHYGCELERGDFQPIRIVEPGTGRQLGVVYATFGVIDGNRAMVLRGIEPKRSFEAKINPKSFIDSLIPALSKIAEANGYTLYTNTGNEDWADDGGIAQVSEIREALRNYAEARGSRPQKLRGEELIKFPKKMGPITWVARLDGSRRD